MKRQAEVETALKTRPLESLLMQLWGEGCSQESDESIHFQIQFSEFN